MRILAAASRTCRAWFKLCSPEMYCGIVIRSPRTVRELIEDLSTPGSHIAQHARELTIRGPAPWWDLPKLLKLLPSLDEMWIWDRDELTDAYDPNLWPKSCRMLAASRTVPALTKLDLRYLLFHSAVDILRLCASLPSLSVARLRDCSISSKSEIVSCASAPNVSQLKLLIQSDNPSEAACLAQWWRWSHPAASRTIGLFPGLRRVDSQTVCEIIKSLGVGGFTQ